MFSNFFFSGLLMVIPSVPPTFIYIYIYIKETKTKLFFDGEKNSKTDTCFRQRTLCSYHVMLLFKKTFTVLVLELTFEIFLRIIIIVYGSDIRSSLCFPFFSILIEVVLAKLIFRIYPVFHRFIWKKKTLLLLIWLIEYSYSCF